MDRTVGTMMPFAVTDRDGAARAGELVTSHGLVPTPAFMPVGTQASVKSLSPDEIAATGAHMVIMNTYHLWLRPGPDVVEAHGGLHDFSRWPRAIATDSGGFQAFSLADRVKLDEQGFHFASHLDGSRLLLSPEQSMRIQGALASDIALQLDVCPPGTAPPEEMLAAVERTTRWAHRCLDAKRPGQALFAIVQGGTDTALRLRHAAELSELPVDGIALGGFSVGEPNEGMHRTLGEVCPKLDPSRPHYLMGVGTPLDLVRAIAVGVDIFDCVMPTRNARNGQAFTSQGKVVIKHNRYRHDLSPLDGQCECPTCRGGYSRAYLRHLFLARELLVHRLMTVHNLWFYGRLVADARRAIVEQRYAGFLADKLRALGADAS